MKRIASCCLAILFLISLCIAPLTVTAVSEAETVVGGASQVVNAKTVAVKSVSLNKTKIELCVGNTFTLKATVKPDNATNKKVKFFSSNPKVATVNATSGVITAKSKGTTTITVKTDSGGKTAKATVTVKLKPVPVSSLSVPDKQAKLDMKIGDTQTLTVTVNPSNATDKSLTFSSDKPSIATVDKKNGKISAVSAGNCTITVQSNSNKNVQLKIPVKVSNVPVQMLKATEHRVFMYVCETTTLPKITITPSNATDKSLVYSVRGFSCTCKGGTLLALRPGISHLTVSSKSNPSAKENFLIIVEQRPEVANKKPSLGTIESFNNGLTITGYVPKNGKIPQSLQEKQYNVLRTGKVTAFKEVKAGKNVWYYWFQSKEGSLKVAASAFQGSQQIKNNYTYINKALTEEGVTRKAKKATGITPNYLYVKRGSKNQIGIVLYGIEGKLINNHEVTLTCAKKSDVQITFKDKISYRETYITWPENNLGGGYPVSRVDYEAALVRRTNAKIAATPRFKVTVVDKKADLMLDAFEYITQITGYTKSKKEQLFKCIDLTLSAVELYSEPSWKHLWSFIKDIDGATEAFKKKPVVTPSFRQLLSVNGLVFKGGSLPAPANLKENSDQIQINVILSGDVAVGKTQICVMFSLE